MAMSTLLFWDPACARQYDSRSILSEATGGTESTVVRIADALGARVVQHNRTEASGRYLPPGRIPDVTDIVVVRDPGALSAVHALHPGVRLHLWMHDQVHAHSTRGRRLLQMSALLREHAVTVICVSDSQRHGVEAALRRMAPGDPVRTRTIYNPIDDALAPDGTPWDPDKLVFFSSPNKGLHYALDAFRALRRHLPGLRLVVGNPGYKPGTAPVIAGVTYLGALPQARIHTEVRTALCTFSPNFVIPETFGLVFAESMALGTPVLAHDCGAAREVIADTAQVLPVSPWQRTYEHVAGTMPPRWRAGPARLAAALGLFDIYAERIGAWQAGARPMTSPDPRFRLATVAAQWRELLNSGRG